MASQPYQDLDPADQALLSEARAMTARSYAPYSRYAVGAAAVGSSGMIHRGANVENASYGLSLCAEVGAITAAHAAGEPDLHTIAVVAGPKDSGPGDKPAAVGTPCGRCRQLIHEVAARRGEPVRILISTPALDRVLVTSSDEMLPEPFGPDNVQPR